ncbi:hypothetical protein QUF88_01115 [Bacillus sp. DX1.1]|uniref:hypothetical protein n=1 Tax=Bacillus sp. DX1.1 TaxID=3055866 RepID=UPI0025A1DEF7|nr:hypothetical protein [Bacillus sp. DX1.1]MDM5152613.1 hypothetical protein [Bacillus sp. DX1.1]
MRGIALASIIVSLGILGACSQGNSNDMKDMDHSSMDMKGMDHSSMEMIHESITELKSSLGENELTFPKVLKPDQEDNNSISYTVQAQQGTSELFEGIETKTYGYNGDF